MSAHEQRRNQVRVREYSSRYDQLRRTRQRKQNHSKKGRRLFRTWEHCIKKAAAPISQILFRHSFLYAHNLITRGRSHIGNASNMVKFGGCDGEDYLLDFSRPAWRFTRRDPDRHCGSNCRSFELPTFQSASCVLSSGLSSPKVNFKRECFGAARSHYTGNYFRRMNGPESG